MCKLSVVVPIYNVEPYLRKCIDSIVAQTCRDLEIVLVDDGSPDNCGAICDEYVARDERVKVIHKENGGLTTALNAGLKQAAGEWVAFVDADDWVDTDYYGRMLSAIKPGIVSDIHFAQGYYEEAANRPATVRYVYEAPIGTVSGTQKEPLLVRTLIDANSQKGWLPANGFYWNKIYRRAFLRANGLHFAKDILAKDPGFDALFVFQALCKAKTITGGGYSWLSLQAGRRIRCPPI